jgi:hypothetical protein
MAYINDLFKIIITEMPFSWLRDWQNNYMSFVKDIEQLCLSPLINWTIL